MGRRKDTGTRSQVPMSNPPPPEDKDAPPPQPPRVVAAAPPGLGHRERLRDRLFNVGGDGFADHELLELLLFSAIPRQDLKPLAKRLIEGFGSLKGLLSANREELRNRFKLADTTIGLILVAGEIARRQHRKDIERRPLLSSWEHVQNYCLGILAHERVEMLHVLFLDRKNRLIADDRMHRGTVDQTAAYPREIAKRALEYAASALILVHNHPSGDPEPSQADIEVTRDIVLAAHTLGLAVHDHLIVGNGLCFSFRQRGLLSPL